jgi:hypothetical protein
MLKIGGDDYFRVSPSDFVKTMCQGARGGDRSGGSVWGQSRQICAIKVNLLWENVILPVLAMC